MKGTYTREQVNEAMWQVFTHQYKKEALEAHKIVSEAGYEIYKEYGDWHVKNKDTNRNISLVHLKNGRRYISHGWCHRQQRVLGWNENRVPFDFVGCLDKPENKAYHNNPYSYHAPKTAMEKFAELWRARRRVEYEEERLEDIQAEIAKMQAKILNLQKETIRRTENRIKAQQELVETKKAFGLSV